jgi:hypothetical protein
MELQGSGAPCMALANILAGTSRVSTQGRGPSSAIHHLVGKSQEGSLQSHTGT